VRPPVRKSSASGIVGDLRECGVKSRWQRRRERMGHIDGLNCLHIWFLVAPSRIVLLWITA